MEGVEEGRGATDVGCEAKSRPKGQDHGELKSLESHWIILQYLLAVAKRWAHHGAYYHRVM